MTRAVLLEQVKVALRLHSGPMAPDPAHHHHHRHRNHGPDVHGSRPRKPPLQPDRTVHRTRRRHHLQVSESNNRRRPAVRRIGDPITFQQQAMGLKAATQDQGITSVSARGTMMGRLAHGGEETNPNVLVVGGDEAFLPMSGYDLSAGRNFSPRKSAAMPRWSSWDRTWSTSSSPRKGCSSTGTSASATAATASSAFSPSRGLIRHVPGQPSHPLPVGEIRARFSGPRTSYSIQIKAPDPDAIGLAPKG